MEEWASNKEFDKCHFILRICHVMPSLVCSALKLAFQTSLLFKGQFCQPSLHFSILIVRKLRDKCYDVNVIILLYAEGQLLLSWISFWFNKNGCFSNNVFYLSYFLEPSQRPYGEYSYIVHPTTRSS